LSEVVKVTISLPSDLLHLTDETAQAEHKPRSGIIRDALTSYIKELECQEMVKGYQEMAALNHTLAEEPMAAVNETRAKYDWVPIGG